MKKLSPKEKFYTLPKEKREDIERFIVAIRLLSLPTANIFGIPEAYHNTSARMGSLMGSCNRWYDYWEEGSGKSRHFYNMYDMVKETTELYFKHNENLRSMLEKAGEDSLNYATASSDLTKYNDILFNERRNIILVKRNMEKILREVLADDFLKSQFFFEDKEEPDRIDVFTFILTNLNIILEASLPIIDFPQGYKHSYKHHSISEIIKNVNERVKKRYDKVVSGDVELKIKNNLKNPVDIYCNDVMLQGAIELIVENAIDFSTTNYEHSTVTMRITKNGNFVKIQITDKGGGVSEDFLKHDCIMERPALFNINESKERNSCYMETHTGIGATAAYYIIKDIGGTVDVKSKLGKGTTVIIKLPCGFNFPKKPKLKKASSLENVQAQLMYAEELYESLMNLIPPLDFWVKGSPQDRNNDKFHTSAEHVIVYRGLFSKERLSRIKQDICNGQNSPSILRKNSILAKQIIEEFSLALRPFVDFVEEKDFSKYEKIFGFVNTENDHIPPNSAFRYILYQTFCKSDDAKHKMQALREIVPEIQQAIVALEKLIDTIPTEKISSYAAIDSAA
ncbi:MAG: ATP-binding protein [Candidatus Omnitrophota bacterium]